MHYYSSNIPKAGQIVLGHLIDDKEQELCLYVRIPEYGNIEGIIPKTNLPKKKRTFKKVLAKMRKENIIPCVIKTEPRFSKDGTMLPLDISLKNIDKNVKKILVDRFNNIRRILKIFIFLSEETNTKTEDLVAGVWKECIFELFANRIRYDEECNNDSESESDIDNNSDNDESPQSLTDLSDLYQKLIGDHDYMIDMIRIGTVLEPELESRIRNIMKKYTQVNKSDCLIKFEFRIDNADDSVQVIRDTFTEIIDQIPNLMLYYNGSPNYVAVKQDVGPEDLDDEIHNLENIFKNVLTKHKCEYYLKFSLQESEAKKPIYTFMFPRMIEV